MLNKGSTSSGMYTSAHPHSNGNPQREQFGEECLMRHLSFTIDLPIEMTALAGLASSALCGHAQSAAIPHRQVIVAENSTISQNLANDAATAGSTIVTLGSRRSSNAVDASSLVPLRSVDVSNHLVIVAPARPVGISSPNSARSVVRRVLLMHSTIMARSLENRGPLVIHRAMLSSSPTEK